MGRKKYEPADKDKQQVSVLGALGLKDEQIALVLGVSESTLQKYYNTELKSGRVLALARVGQTAYNMAISGEQPAMTMFFLKCRGGWREKPDETPPEKDTSRIIEIVKAEEMVIEN